MKDSSQQFSNNIRAPILCGNFYPADAEELDSGIRHYLEQAETHLTPCADKQPLGLMLPHAGHMFSGIVAGLTLGQTDLPETVIMLGPSHRAQGTSLALWPDGEWITPLGRTPVATELCNELAADPATNFKPDTLMHVQEHSLEVLLPFLQAITPKLRIVPICVWEYELQALKQAGKALARLIRRQNDKGLQACIVASTDMSHYLPHAKAKRYDALALEQVSKINPEGLYQVVRQHNISMCGFTAVCIMLFACRELGASECCITASTSSGVTGKNFGASMESVVGYAGAIIPAPVD